MMKLSLLSPRDLSVVVQGPVLSYSTRRSLESIRKHLPGAQIILSTWEGGEIEGLDYDVLVLNKDPGPVETKAIKGVNLNRLIWSTRQGLKEAERPYCLKFRTDFELLGSRILSCFGQFSDYLPDYKIFQERIVISSVMTWSATRYPPGQFHPSDMFGLGRTEDLGRWWNVPLYSFSGRAQWESEPVLLGDEEGCVPVNELAPEQYIWLSALNRTRKVCCRKNPTPEERRRDLLLLLNNFVVMEARRVDIQWLKPMELPFGYQASLVGFPEYRYLYRKEVEGRSFQWFPVSILWKIMQLMMLKFTPDAPKIFWRFYKNLRGLNRREVPRQK